MFRVKNNANIFLASDHGYVKKIMFRIWPQPRGSKNVNGGVWGVPQGPWGCESPAGVGNLAIVALFLSAKNF